MGSKTTSYVKKKTELRVRLDLVWGEKLKIIEKQDKIISEVRPKLIYEEKEKLNKA